MSIQSHIREHAQLGTPGSLDTLKSESSGAATPDHLMKWNDQSGQGHGPITLTAAYATFTGASFTVVGNTNTSITITNLVTTARIVVGMTITGTDIPASTTVASIVSGTSITISQAAIGTTAGVTFTFNAGAGSVTDPLAIVGYNITAGGTEYVSGRGYAGLQIEGHYDRGATGDVWMEAFFAFKGPTASTAARPFFFAYDKSTNKPQDVHLSPGIGKDLLIKFEDYTGGASTPGYVFEENIFNIYQVSGTADTSLRLGSVATGGSSIYFGSDGDLGKLQMRCAVAGTQNAFEMLIYDNAATPVQKTGKFLLGAFTFMNTPTLTFGVASTSNHSLVDLDNSNAVTNVKVLTLKCIASQSVPALEIDGTTNAGASEAAKYQVYPKGYIAVKPSGGASTSPTTGASTVAFNLTNCPGTGTTTKWFPILDTAGVLHWVPGVSAA